jgi:mannose-6-phosphate isomerase-like protein (cupin superfamily)
MDIRCVVTGQNTSGKSIFVRDAPVAPVTLALLPGFEFHRLWGSESAVQLPSDGTAPPPPGYFPPKNGFRFGFFTVPPEADSELAPADLAAAFGELREKLPGMAEVLEPENPGMHTTDTVDFDVVISGEVYLVLDDGFEVLLKAGDCVVQNGTRHAWRNRSGSNCVIAVTLVGAERGR